MSKKLKEKQTAETIKQAISNYSVILKSDLYFFKYRWTLVDFLNRGLEKFLDLEAAKQNYTATNIKLKNTNVSDNLGLRSSPEALARMARLGENK